MISIIDDNYKGENESFMDYLHESGIFREDLLMELIFEIIALSKELSLEEDISQYKNYLRKLFKICDHTNNCLIGHFNKDDFYKIKNLNDDFYAYRDRLSYVFDKFIYLDYKAMEKYEDDLGSLRKE